MKAAALLGIAALLYLGLGPLSWSLLGIAALLHLGWEKLPSSILVYLPSIAQHVHTRPRLPWGPARWDDVELQP